MAHVDGLLKYTASDRQYLNSVKSQILPNAAPHFDVVYTVHHLYNMYINQQDA